MERVATRNRHRGAQTVALIHGEAKHSARTVEYILWKNIWQRCTNPNHPRYSDYGGRGITVDPKWKDFESFLEDVGRRPDGEFSLGRRKNNEGYNKENCQWETRLEQAKNKRVKGVGYDWSNNTWRARVARKGVKYFVGNFKTEIEALEARQLFLENVIGED